MAWLKRLARRLLRFAGRDPFAMMAADRWGQEAWQKSKATSRSKEVEANYEAFVALLPTIIEHHRGQYALMKGKKILEFYPTAMDAWMAGEVFVQDKLFSIQEVTDVDVDLGYFTDAVHSSSV